MSRRTPFRTADLDLPSLGPNAAEQLDALVDEAGRRQSKQLDDAIDGGLGHLPRLLRGTVKAVLFR